MPIQSPEHFYHSRKFAWGPSQSIPNSPNNHDLISITIG